MVALIKLARTSFETAFDHQITEWLETPVLNDDFVSAKISLLREHASKMSLRGRATRWLTVDDIDHIPDYPTHVLDRGMGSGRHVWG